MQTTSVVVKNKWQNLRDTYRKEYMKTLPTGSGSKGFISKWKYFELLTFLNAPRRVVSNVLNQQENTNSESPTYVNEESNEFNSNLESQDCSEITSKQDKTQDQNTANTDVLENPEHANTFVTPKNNKKRNRSQKDSISDLLAIEKQKIAHLDVIASKSQQNTEIQDEDYFFVMSLLPHLRSIPEDHKLQTRNKIQELIIEQKQLCVSTPSPSTSWTQEYTNHSLLSQNNTQQNTYHDVCPPTTTTQDFTGMLSEFVIFSQK